MPASVIAKLARAKSRALSEMSGDVRGRDVAEREEPLRDEIRFQKVAEVGAVPGCARC
jgi:hypothetical protein